MWLLFMLAMFSQYLLEPLYNPILSSAPYNLDYVSIGVWATIGPLAGITAGVLVFANLYKKIGVIGQLSLSFLIVLIGFSLLGPSKIVPVEPSFGLLAGALSAIGIGSFAVVIISQVSILDLLWIEARLTKAQCAGSMGAVNRFNAWAMSTFAPTMSTAIYESVGISWLTTDFCIIFAVGCPLPIYFLSTRLTRRTAFGSLFAKETQEAVPDCAVESKQA